MKHPLQGRLIKAIRSET